jgi:multiple sugar transport system ATP-binding protein
VLVGVRPRDLHLASREQGGAGPAAGEGLTVTGTVALAERLGRSVELSVDVSGDTLIVVSSDQRPAEGDTVTVAASGDNVHLFAAGAEDADSPRLGSFGRQAERAAR